MESDVPDDPAPESARGACETCPVRLWLLQHCEASMRHLSELAREQSFIAMLPEIPAVKSLRAETDAARIEAEQALEVLGSNPCPQRQARCWAASHLAEGIATTPVAK